MENSKKATKNLFYQIISTSLENDDPPNAHDLHDKGINIRHVGLLIRQNQQMKYLQFVRKETICRTMKVDLRNIMRKTLRNANPITKAIEEMVLKLNIILQVVHSPKSFPKLSANLEKMVSQKFGLEAKKVLYNQNLMAEDINSVNDRSHVFHP